MVKKSFTPEQIINKLREAEILLSQGTTVGEASKKIGVTQQTYYRWPQRIWWHAGRAGEKTQRIGERERPPQEASCRPLAG